MMETGHPDSGQPFDRSPPCCPHDATTPLGLTARTRNLWVALPILVCVTAALIGSLMYVRIQPEKTAYSIGVVSGRVYMSFLWFTAVCVVVRRHQGSHVADVPDVDLSSDVLALAMGWAVPGLSAACCLLWVEIEEIVSRHGITDTDNGRIGIAVVLAIVSVPSLLFLWKRHKVMSARRTTTTPET